MNTYEERKKEILEDQIIVLSDEHRIIVWSGGAVFGVYDHDLNEVDCFICYGVKSTLEAQQVAMRHALRNC